MKYPDDANGDALRRMEAIGDDLSQPRDIEFTAVFPNESDAKPFAEHFRANGYTASIERTGTMENFPWDVVVVRHMVPSHGEIGEFEELLRHVATTFGGQIDGWGCSSG